MDIRILPGNIANMIAAGEVVQRPASVVKELMENAVDAGADTVRVILQDAGRTLIQVIDNGCGMSPDEAVLCFERHATSKIASAEDLEAITTFGFRGEALASIAAVAEVTLRTRREDDEVGCEVFFADSVHQSTEMTASPAGSNFAVRNLFYNIPARRKFLKSDNVEMKHNVTEFLHVALTRPEINFTLTSNGKDLYVLRKASSLKFRIQDLLGSQVVNSVIDLYAETSVVRVSGYVGRPDAARKSQGNQFFFINGRYFRSPYLHKAVMKAYERLVPEGQTPPYFIYLEADPHTFDVNISPTKTEIKFEDDNVLFQILYACVREALGKGSFGDAIDFDREGAPEIPVLSRKFTESQPFAEPEMGIDPTFNPFDNDGFPSESSPYLNSIGDLQGIPSVQEGGVPVRPSDSWKSFSERSSGTSSYVDRREDYGRLFEEKTVRSADLLVFGGKYIVFQQGADLAIVNVRRAWEKILYEKYRKMSATSERSVQPVLFPVTVEIGVDNMFLFAEYQPVLEKFGFDIRPFGKDTIVVNGIPEGFSGESCDIERMIPDLILALSDDMSAAGDSMLSSAAEKFARLGAMNASSLKNVSEAQRLLDELFACSNGEYTDSGKKIMKRLSADDVESLFSRSAL